MFKANNHIYKKHGFSKFDHAWVRRKTHQNELDGWKHDDFIILGNMGESIGPALVQLGRFFDYSQSWRAQHKVLAFLITKQQSTPFWTVSAHRHGVEQVCRSECQDDRWLKNRVIPHKRITSGDQPYTS